jgi:serine/threonine protein phosphatase PrpC
MPDPQVLYIVAAVVMLGLVAFVIVVLASPEGKERARAGVAARPGGDGGPAHPPPAGESSQAKPWLHSYAEIHDEPGADVDIPITTHDPGSSGPATVEVDDEDEPTGPNALILVTAVGRTDPGLKRKHNEDAYAILEDHHLFVIADGMGRHAAGEVASRLCVDAIVDAFRHSSFGPARQPPLPRRAAKLRGATLLANDRILAAAKENEAYEGMGTTVVSAYFSANNQRVYIAHVGDSRCYRLRAGTLTQLTVDHTLGAAGIVGKTASVLSRAIGVEPDVEVDVAIELPRPGDVYLLCSDGLSRMVAADEIQSTLAATEDLDQATKSLTDLANRGGGRDNITVILVRVDDARAPS